MTTAALDNPHVEIALQAFSSSANWNYDNTKLRLYHWAPTPGAWVEYASDKSDQFKFTPGNVVWLKTRKTDPFNLGSGRTVSLKQNCPITLPAQSWTDFSIPYNFNVRVGDVLDSSHLSAEEKNLLQFRAWRIPNNETRYSSEVVFWLPDVNNSNSHTELETGDNSIGSGAYVVYNKSDHAVTLQIPPLPPALSRLAGKTAVAQPKGWSIAVRPRIADGALSSISCGYNESLKGLAAAFPLPPSFAAVNVGIYDERSGSTYGSYISGERKDGYAYELVFDNSQADATTVNFAVNRSAGLGKEMQIALIDPSSSLGNGVDAEQGTLSVSVPPQSRAYRWLAVGSAEFTKSFGATLERSSFALLSMGPNPFRGMLRIHYSLPLSGIESVRFEIVDQRGRMLWSTRESRSIHPGRNEIAWKPHNIAAGAYILRMNGFDGTGRVVGQKMMRILYLP
jgi:hypothetical protein